MSAGILQTVANIDFLNADLSNLRRLLSTIDVLMKSKISSRDLIQQNAIEDPFVLSQHGYNGGVNNSIKYLITFETKQAPSFQQNYKLSNFMRYRIKKCYFRKNFNPLHRTVGEI